MSRRSLQAPLAALLLSGGVLLSVATGTATTGSETEQHLPSALDAPTLSIDVRPGRIHMRGTTVSAAHEAGLLRLAGDEFGRPAVHTDFRPGALLASSWEAASSRLLYALAATESAQAVMSKDAVEIRGATADAETFAERLEFLRDELPADAALLADVVSIDSSTPHAVLCRRAFSQLVTQPISFRQSSAEISTSSYATLEGIADFANDCRELRIAVTGHTDASGDESWNRHLSLLRAQAVADHLIGAGVDHRRLQVRGVGSAVPIADNASAHGRSRNRRIEFSLL